MAQNVQKTSENAIEDANVADDFYYWNLNEDFCANSQFKSIHFSSDESASSIGSSKFIMLIGKQIAEYQLRALLRASSSAKRGERLLETEEKQPATTSPLQF
uniref:Uncharacterized protein n=1 Tax=Cannabis sativa TaxID=3483 RepID=A0A803NHT1_CANSA